MIPPFRITGDPPADWALFIVGFFVCLYWLRGLRLAREGARVFLRSVARSMLLFLAVMFLLAGTRAETRLTPSQEQLIAGIVAVVFFASDQQRRKRSRHIPQAVRRAVIARDLKGEKFDSERHHIDHVWPFSKGGSHTVDNLRVVEKKKNLQKGSKRPGLRDMW